MKKSPKKYVVLIAPFYANSADYLAFSFETEVEVQKFTQGGWRDEVEDIGDVDEDKIFIAVIQSRYVSNPSFVPV